MAKLLCKTEILNENKVILYMSQVSKVYVWNIIVSMIRMSEVSKVKKYMYVVCTRLMSEVSKFTNVQNDILVFNDTVYTSEVSKEILTM